MLSLPASWSTNSRTGSTGRGSEFLRPARYRVLPHSLPVLLEDELGVRWRGEPDALRQLALELPGSPAGVAECHQALFRASVHGDVAQDLAARRHRQLGVDRHGIGTGGTARRKRRQQICSTYRHRATSRLYPQAAPGVVHLVIVQLDPEPSTCGESAIRATRQLSPR